MSPKHHVKVENQEKEIKKRKSVPFTTRFSTGHCSDFKLEEGQGIVHASLRDPTQAPGRHLQTHATARPEEAGAQAESTHTYSRASHCLQQQTAQHRQGGNGWHHCTREHRPSSNGCCFQSFVHSQVSTMLRHQHLEVTDTGKRAARPGIWHLNMLKLHVSSCGMERAQTSTRSRDVSARHSKVISAHAQGFEEFSSPHSSSAPKPLA